MAASLQRGQVLDGRIELLEPIGQGGMGSVWLADHLKLGCNVAVKFIAAAHAQKEELRERFEREAATAARIKHPHVVEIHDHGTTDDGTPYIVMELLRGTSLEDRLRGEPLSIEQLKEVYEQTTKALKAAHAQGVIHRDLKPANLFLAEVTGYETFIKVLDFGVAKDATADGTPTASGALVGTVQYMSPEQLESPKEVDSQADAWALAVIAYEMLTGSRPFDAASLPKVAVKIADGSFSAPSHVKGGLPPAVDRWFVRALNKDASRRFDDLDAAKKELFAALDAVVDPVAETQVAATSRDSAGARAGESASAGPSAAPWARWAIAGGVIVAIGLGAWMLRPTSERSPASTVAPSASAPASSSASAPPPKPAAPNGSSEMDPAWARVAQATMRRNTDAFLACFAGKDANGRPMVRTITFRALTNGRVDRAALAEQSYRAPEFDRCLLDAVRGLRFPAPPEPASIRYPIVFTNEIPLNDEACSESADCMERGRCSAVDEECQAADDTDCRLAKVCVFQGLCTAQQGKCVAPSECSTCKETGLCEPSERGCVATDASCAKSAMCRRQGLCTARSGVCVPADDVACESAEVCEREGHCSARPTRCRADSDEACAASHVCKRRGACAALAGRCAATEDKHCQKSEDCERYGHCSVTSSGMCGALTDADCADSEECKRNGHCTAEAGVCNPTE